MKEAIRFLYEYKDNEKSKRFVVNGVCLFDKNHVPNNAIVSGWGQTDQYKDVSNQLLKVRLPKYDWQKCKDHYKLNNVMIYDYMICYGGGGHKDTCMGDSGGPLIIYKNGRAYLIGVISFGIPCANKGLPGVYIQVSKFKDWIKNIAELV